MPSPRAGGRWVSLLEDARVWPRRIVLASIVASLIIVALLVVYYIYTGNRAVIPAIVILVASIPLDLLVLKTVLEGGLYSNAVELSRVLDEAGAVAFKSRPVFNGVLVAVRVNDGFLHVLLKPSMIQAVYIRSPSILPIQGRLKPIIKARIRPPRSARRCIIGSVEDLIEIASLDPSLGIPIQARGAGRYVFKACPNTLSPRDVREVLSLVLA